MNDLTKHVINLNEDFPVKDKLRILLEDIDSETGLSSNRGPDILKMIRDRQNKDDESQT